MSIAVGKRIRFFRWLRGMTQKELGKAVGFSSRTASVRIAQYEIGARTPKPELLRHIANALRACIHSRGCHRPEGLFRQARRIFAGILCVLQENSTRLGGKKTGQTAFEVVNTGS